MGQNNCGVKVCVPWLLPDKCRRNRTEKTSTWRLWRPQSHNYPHDIRDNNTQRSGRGAILRQRLVAFGDAGVEARKDPSVQHGQISSTGQYGRGHVRIAQVAQSEFRRVPYLVAEVAVAFDALHVKVDVTSALKHVPDSPSSCETQKRYNSSEWGGKGEGHERCKTEA
jgi:hypothetical protein